MKIVTLSLSLLLALFGAPAATAVLFAACAASLVHVEPAPRTPIDASRAAVDIRVTCASADLASTRERPLPDIQWREPSRGRGVMISERHVLTAAHVVRCPDHPVVRVTLYDGRTFRMIVDRDEAIFEGKRDGLARLVIPSGSTFQRYIAPPELGDSDGVHYMIARRSGTVSGARRDIARHFGPGDSGSGVYAPSGELVGLLLGGSDSDIAIARVDASWLEGT